MSPWITYHTAIVANSYFIYVHIYTSWRQWIRPALTECMQIPHAHRLTRLGLVEHLADTSEGGSLQDYIIQFEPAKPYWKMANPQESEYQELKTIILAGARATEAYRELSPNHKYCYLACLCCLACGCRNRCYAWPLPLDKCYNYELLDRACVENPLADIGYELYWFCIRCGLPSSCGGEG